MLRKESVANQDINRQVHIKVPVLEVWINSMTDFAVSRRLQKQINIVDIEQDHAFVEKTGALMMSTTVDGEPVRMVVPDEMWSFYNN